MTEEHFEILKPKNDIMFKKMFADENNKDMLIDLIASLMDIPINDIGGVKVLNPEINISIIHEKFSQLDILVEENKNIIDLEMQTVNQKDFLDRVMVYWAKMCAGDVKEGKSYSKLHKNVSISIMDFRKFETGNDYWSKFMLYDEKHKIYMTDKCAFYFFELPKMTEKDKPSRKELWLKLINSNNKEELDMMEQYNVPIINKAVDVVKSLSSDPETRELIRIREDAAHQRASLLSEAREEGRQEIKEQIIKKMKERNMTQEDIIYFFGENYSEDDV